MGRVLLDTNTYTALLAGNNKIADELSRSDAVLLSPVVLGELLDGFEGGSRKSDNRKKLSRFREKPRTVCIPITDETAEWFTHIKQQLRRKGKPVPINDVWIAASCMEHGAKLISLDAHFANIDGLLRWGTT